MQLARQQRALLLVGLDQAPAQVAHLVLGAPALRDVAEDTVRPDPASAGVAAGDAGQVLDPALPPRRMEVAILDGEPLQPPVLQLLAQVQTRVRGRRDAGAPSRTRGPGVPAPDPGGCRRGRGSDRRSTIVPVAEVHLVEREAGEVGTRRQARLAGAQRLLAALPLGDVLHHGDEVPGLASRAPHERDGQVDPHRGTVPADIALLHRVVSDLAGEEPGGPAPGPLQVVGVGDVLEGPAQQLLARIADDRAEPVVDPQPAAVDRRRGRCPPPPARTWPRSTLLALAQRPVGALAGERVGEHLRHQVQPPHQRLRPVALRAHRIQRHDADRRFAPHAERQGEVRPDSGAASGLHVDGRLRRRVVQRRERDDAAGPHLPHDPGVLLLGARTAIGLGDPGGEGVGGHDRLRVDRRPLPQGCEVEAERLADPAQGVLDLAVDLAGEQVDEPGGEIRDQDLEREEILGTRRGESCLVVSGHAGEAYRFRSEPGRGAAPGGDAAPCNCPKGQLVPGRSPDRTGSGSQETQGPSRGMHLATGGRSTRRFLVVDDDPDVRAALGRLLRSHGLPARTFGSAEEYLAAAAAGDRVTLILDVRLPEMSGRAAGRLGCFRAFPRRRPASSAGGRRRARRHRPCAPP